MSGVNPNPAQVFQVEFDANNKLSFYNQTIGIFRLTTAVYRDVGAWYHIVFVADTNNATAQSRFRVWVNGVEVTVWDTNSTISLSYSFAYNGAYLHGIGAYTYSLSSYFDGYLAEVNFIDGQALTPSSFGTYDTNGVWQPVKYNGTYGTNGFYLPFSNTTSTATLGNDFSGNSNTWTVNNISLTAGVTYDSMTDSPTVSSASVANYAVLNPLNKGTNQTIANGNLTNTSSGQGTVLASIGVTTGKWYGESTLTVTGAGGIGFTSNPAAESSYTEVSGKWWCYDNGGGFVIANQTSTTVYATRFAAGQVWQWAIDAVNGKVWIGVNNSWLDSTNGTTGNPSTGANPTFTFTVGLLIWPFLENAGGPTWNANFGQRPFTYTPPTGFNALNTYNLPTPTIANGAQYMAATTYTGTGATQTISDGGNNTIGTTFQPDFVWLKSRSAATDHALYDVVRGTTKDLASNTTAAETTQATGLTAFGSTGFTIGALAKINTSAATYVGWQWLAGNSSGSSNTNGSITSTVSANTTAGFSIVTYTGTGASNPTIGHGLGVTPNMIILKDRNTNTNNNNWQVYHSSLTSGYFLSLNATDAQAAISGTSYGSVGQPTSTTFKGVAGSVDSTTTNQNTQLYVAYCWAAVAGYSAFGSYTGNGSTDGPFLYFGFRPRFIMWKRTDTAGYPWYLMDTSRATYNQMTAVLYANASDAEANFGGEGQDFVSNGWKIRASSPGSNTNGGTYIYAAFAENPFNSSRAR
jgi:hypothetical protein